MKLSVMKNKVVELIYESSQYYSDPYNEVQFGINVINPDGNTKRIPGFWGGDNIWRVRYSSSKKGKYKFKTVCSDKTNKDLEGRTGEITVIPYEGKNPLYKHGPLKVSKNKKYLEHEDGKPFFWLADSWHFALSARHKWPETFQITTQDRLDKGYNVIVLVAGFNVGIDAFDERGANEGGFPMDKNFNSINPAYFDMADLKIGWLVNSEIVPCIYGVWGYHIEKIGQERMKKYWDYLVARYGAYPVVWCIAGEAVMPFYLSEARGSEAAMKAYREKCRKEWTEVTKHVKTKDPYSRVITIHPPSGISRWGKGMIEDESLLDLEIFQAGHAGIHVLSRMVKTIRETVNKKPRRPVINAEVAWEKLANSNYEDIQRFAFWSCVLSGACGHTYGANGLWQMNTKEKPFGGKVDGRNYGNTPWEDALKLPGSKQVGLGKKLFEKYKWWEFEMHPEWVENHSSEENGYFAPYAAGIPSELRIIFITRLGFKSSFNGENTVIKKIEPDIKYKAYYFDPITGDEYKLGMVTPDEEGKWNPDLNNVYLVTKFSKISKFPPLNILSPVTGKLFIMQDWVLVLERIKN